jgi:DNA polymerase (family X)
LFFRWKLRVGRKGGPFCPRLGRRHQPARRQSTPRDSRRRRPYVNIIGHPTTRRIGKRPPVEVDFGELFRACARTGTAQRGWLTPDDVINTWPLDTLRAFLRKGR